ncbi:hypothetical protein SAMN02745216_01178 [Desulfatibacillum alkenivorans DSM 16219]|jgi:putative sterol carrier protein|uniref:SCP-2 sterol transfer family protein n=1 Tax=Desulfatibacillum alkenivorans DSM 16219 TaxID=1121393 RepID=A0A1M6HBG5_9BACT|nr:hypothetical protein [Desulfatibacillum alkenivorans]SHJ19567.1 hypothetical protein SAMN02745216_01178 [Desulfatibacillum alkenivorans DSM 16219]
MSRNLVLANLNLYAVLPNLEELVRHDQEMALLIKDWDICIQFSALGGPAAFAEFKNGECTVGRGKHFSPTVKLFFATPGHLNKMFDGKAQPIPLKGFTKLGFLSKEFSKLTDRMEYYLKPSEESLSNPDFVSLNTLMTMHTAGRAVVELAVNDPVASHVSKGMMDGSLLMKVLPDGPAITLNFKNGKAGFQKGETASPMACMLLKDMDTANKLLNQKLDAFSAIAGGEVIIKGQTPMMDAMDLILDRIPHYLDA